MTREFKVGDVVVLGTDRAGAGGVVSQPITEDAIGHVLTLRDGRLVGIPATMEDVVSADEDSQGFTQLAYSLIKLGSHIIEQKLLLYRF
jgi:hypothetical protein